ncbi:MAG: hypothetical protein WKG07_13585 [Hymenobacter sp.]
MTWWGQRSGRRSKSTALDSPMCNGAELNLTDGFNDPQFHAVLQKQYAAMIPLVAQAGYTNYLLRAVAAGKTDASRAGPTVVLGLTPLLKLAAQHRWMLAMELLTARLTTKTISATAPWGRRTGEKIKLREFQAAV